MKIFILMLSALSMAALFHAAPADAGSGSRYGFGSTTGGSTRLGSGGRSYRSFGTPYHHYSYRHKHHPQVYLFPRHFGRFYYEKPYLQHWYGPSYLYDHRRYRDPGAGAGLPGYAYSGAGEPVEPSVKLKPRRNFGVPRRNFGADWHGVPHPYWHDQGLGQYYPPRHEK